jgi:hypothetical protein
MWRTSADDQKLIEEIGKLFTIQRNGSNSESIIYDARPYLNAVGNIAHGGGYEDTNNYKISNIVFCDIGNIHDVS